MWLFSSYSYCDDRLLMFMLIMQPVKQRAAANAPEEAIQLPASFKTPFTYGTVSFSSSEFNT